MSTPLESSSSLPSSNHDHFKEADGITRAAAAKALEERGLRGIDQLLQANTPVEILGWCRWWDQQRGVGIELLASRIFTGKSAPKAPGVGLDGQKAYGERVRRWLLEKLPDVCRDDPRVVEWEGRLYGDGAIVSSVPEPHPAAVAAVLRLHWRHGKGALTVREHGPEIRSAVKRANEQAVADYRAIVKQREREAAVAAGPAQQEEE